MPDGRTPLDPLVAPAAPPLELAARVRAAVEQTRAPRVALRERLALAIVGIPLAVLGGLLGSRVAFPGRPLFRLDSTELPLVGFATRLSILLLIAGLATAVALAPGRRALGSKVTWLVVTAIAIAPLYTLVTNIFPLGTPLGDAAARELHPLGLPCAIVALVVGAISLILFGIALQRMVPAAAVNRAAALGSAAGAWAGVALFLQCPANDALHLLVGHSLPVAGFALIGALSLPRWLRP